VSTFVALKDTSFSALGHIGCNGANVTSVHQLIMEQSRLGHGWPQFLDFLMG
jgi:hypothetical protein